MGLPTGASDLWVFGYGSLMWNPGFPFVERRRARLEGWSRQLCIWSQVYRGTPEAPGLVFGLATGGACDGVAFRVAGAEREATIAYLRERELISYVYKEIEAEAELDDGRRVAALTYVADYDHAQFAGGLSLDETLAVIRRSSGRSGANVEYVLTTHAELESLGIEDEALWRVCEALAEG